MVDVIVAVDDNFGIGRNGEIPWHVPDDLSHFRRITNGCNLIVGRTTFDSLPPLSNRKLYVVTSRPHEIPDPHRAYATVEQAISVCLCSGYMTFVIGGGSIYSYVMEKMGSIVRDIYVSRIRGDYGCDTFWKRSNLRDCSLCYTKDFDTFTLDMYRMNARLMPMSVSSKPNVTVNANSSNKNEREYIRVLKRVLDEGELDDNGNGNTLSLFHDSMSFDLREGFPLLTTRRMFLRGIIEELLFFIRGDTNSCLLEEKGINIWKGNTSREFLDSKGFTDWNVGMMGAMYGWQWRHFNAPYDHTTGRPLGDDYGVDQLARVVQDVKEQACGTTRRIGRRLLMATYNPAQVDLGVLPPCHSIIVQFHVKNGYLDMSCYNRSQDLALGTPFNIASHSLLLMIVAKLAGLVPRHLHVTIGVAHIYSEHVDDMRELVKRVPYSSPTLKILKDVTTLEEVSVLTHEDFELSGYQYHSGIKMKMVA